MTKSEETLLALLRVAYSGKAEPLSDNVKWQEVIELASQQGVLAVSFDAFDIMQKTLSSQLSTLSSFPDMDELMDWLGQTSYQETQYEHSWEVACELSELFASVGVKATILKGRSIAQYYPKPNHRYSCDLDIYIPSDGTDAGDWERACKLLEAKGVTLVYEVYKEVEFTYKDVYVECHRYITPVRGNKNLLAFERYLRSLLAAEYYTFDGTQLIAPPLMFTALLYVEHALGDFLRSPLSLKHVCDWMVLRKVMKLRDESLELRESGVKLTFEARCKEFGFELFVQLVDALADVFEGRKTREELPETYRRAFDEIFEDRKGSTRKKSWTERRVNQFFNVLKCGWKYKAFGYMSMPKFLYHALRTHWFDKEVRI